MGTVKQLASAKETPLQRNLDVHNSHFKGSFHQFLLQSASRKCPQMLPNKKALIFLHALSLTGKLGVFAVFKKSMELMCRTAEQQHQSPAALTYTGLVYTNTEGNLEHITYAIFIQARLRVRSQTHFCSFGLPLASYQHSLKIMGPGGEDIGCTVTLGAYACQ